MLYPVAYEADYAPRRSRATAFFRILLAIPVILWLYVYALVAGVAVVFAWVSIVLTARYPAGLYRFVAGFVRFLGRTIAYTTLLTDAYPPFGGGEDNAYPVRVHFAGPLARYSRGKTFFRGLLAIPVMMLRYVMQLLLQLGALFAWFVIIITGRLPQGLFDLMVLAHSYTVRSDAYLYLLTESYPPFQDAQTRAAGVPSVA
jgi:hypothetical protein